MNIPPPPTDPLLDANGPNKDPLPMPSTEGQQVGKSWTEERPNGITVDYTIPEGNGLNTVDAVVRDSQGNILSTARIVRVVEIDGTAKYVRWQSHAGGGASYYESGAPGQLGYGQHFAPGTSTSGLPTSVFDASPDLTKVRTLSLDEGGNPVGVDIGVRNSQGLYDNIHVDNFGNATLSSARWSPSGQLESVFTGQMFANRSGWMVDEQNNHWEGEPDKGGNQSWLRVKNGHTYRMNHLGVITDFSLGKDGRPRLDTIFPDGSQTTQSGRTTVHFDANGNEAWRKDIAAPVQPWDTRAWNATKRGLSSVGSLISDTAGAPFHMARDGMRGMSSVRVDPSGTFHVTYDAPNRFANAGTAAVGLVKGAAMFYLALPKYGAMRGYDALRGSDFVRGSTTYRPPDREDELVKDLTGISPEQWKEDTVGSVFEFGTATAATLLLFRAAGVGRRGGTRSEAVQLFGYSTHVLNSLRKSTSTQFSRLASDVARMQNLVSPGNRSTRLGKGGSGVIRGVDASPDTIRWGTVRMEDHPRYSDVSQELEEIGYPLKVVDSAPTGPRVVRAKIEDENGVHIRTEQHVLVVNGMRYLDLEHELGHVHQLRYRFSDADRPFTARWRELGGGRIREMPHSPGVLAGWQDVIAETHNRLQEYVTLAERDAPRDLLDEHSKALEADRSWLFRYRQVVKVWGPSSGPQKAWADKHFPDMYDLISQYSELRKRSADM
ncbi:hypothetical protein [Nocardia salmonicida]|uniref:hypothetical protein n=1 Tax=Nocardia salmonicida TaxID=53431 RepID=UPI0033F9A9F4